VKQHEVINYLELPAKDLPATRRFFESVFGWRFEDYGPTYLAFFEPGLDGGFYQSEQVVTAAQGSVLIIFYSQDLAATQQKVEAAGGQITRPVFAFPGGRRFHFSDPNGNEFAVWSE